MTLALERKPETKDSDPIVTKGGGLVLITPPITEDYWTYRVKLTKTQAIVGFPKFGVVGIGFAKETDWNTNVPSSCDAEEIYDHIKHNAGDARIKRATVIEAIRMIQAAVAEDGR